MSFSFFQQITQKTLNDAIKYTGTIQNQVYFKHASTAFEPSSTRTGFGIWDIISHNERPILNGYYTAEVVVDFNIYCTYIEHSVRTTDHLIAQFKALRNNIQSDTAISNVLSIQYHGLDASITDALSLYEDDLYRTNFTLDFFYQVFDSS